MVVLVSLPVHSSVLVVYIGKCERLVEVYAWIGKLAEHTVHEQNQRIVISIQCFARTFGALRCIDTRALKSCCIPVKRHAVTHNPDCF